MRVAVVINPQSGRDGGRADSGAVRTAIAERALRAGALGADASVEIEVTRAPGHAAEIADRCRAEDFDLVVAWGGDGTVNEIAGPLIGSRVALGIVPSGSGDGLARGLRLPRRPEIALRTAVTSEPVGIDVGYLGDRHFLNIAGIGFDAAVGQAFNRGRRRGALSYVRSALLAVWSYEPATYRLIVDEQDRGSGRRLLIAFANGPEYGNRLVLSADADLRDGRLNVVEVEAGSALRQIWRARRLAVRPGQPAEGIRRSLATTAEVAAEHMQCHVDGETFEATGILDVRIVPGALLVRS